MRVFFRVIVALTLLISVGGGTTTGTELGLVPPGNQIAEYSNTFGRPVIELPLS